MAPAPRRPHGDVARFAAEVGSFARPGNKSLADYQRAVQAIHAMVARVEQADSVPQRGAGWDEYAGDVATWNTIPSFFRSVAARLWAEHRVDGSYPNVDRMASREGQPERWLAEAQAQPGGARAAWSRVKGDVGQLGRAIARLGSRSPATARRAAGA